MKKITPNDVKKIEVGILDFIDDICKKNSINYFIAYGTLLGAIRHSGFIPWDDDIDICMKREDYNKFMNILASLRHNRYKFLENKLQKNYFYEYGTRTRIITHDVIENDEEGVWVDVFPLDNANFLVKFQKVIIDILIVLRIFSVYTTFPSSKRSKIWYPIWLFSRAIGPKLFISLSTLLFDMCKDNDSKYLAVLCDFGCEYCYDRNLFKELTEVAFEGKMYPAPKNYIAYLTQQYGDFMKLPSVEKQIPHPVEAYWR